MTTREFTQEELETIGKQIGLHGLKPMSAEDEQRVKYCFSRLLGVPKGRLPGSRVGAANRRRFPFRGPILVQLASLLVIFYGASVAAHYTAKFYLRAERIVGEYVVGQANAMIDTAATKLGYERPPIPPDELTVRELVEREAFRWQLNPRLAIANMVIESAEKHEAYSGKGAIGLMQVMPFNFKRCGLKSPAELLDPEKNIACGVQILAEEMKNYKDDPVKALQVYNGGPKCLGVCEESINHARKVMKTWVRDVG